MANIKIAKFAKRNGYCCLWAFITTHRQQSTPELALEIGCTPRTIRYAKAAVRKRITKCAELDKCLKRAISRGSMIF